MLVSDAKIYNDYISMANCDEDLNMQQYHQNYEQIQKNFKDPAQWQLRKYIYYLFFELKDGIKVP